MTSENSLRQTQEAMKTMKSMTELDSSQILVTLSAKLPSYSGVKWCRFAHEEQTKHQKPIGFKDFVQFVKQEAEVANDSVFSPDALKRERNKSTNASEQRGSSQDQDGKIIPAQASPSSPLECSRGHHTLLHRNEPIGKDSKPHPKGKPSQDGTQGRGESTPSTSANANASSISLTSHVESAVITNSKLVPVYVSHRDHPKKEMKDYPLLDDASDTTFVTTKIQEVLGLKGVETELTLSTMSGKEFISVSRIDGLVS
ncbi:hypothetical protein P5673_031658 [Acropora cervicornis]|uniref:Uncharacterized protein n=1 Tax=Acropora cervicornis TaxID=6130 RepID=A0AAD9USC0_ACRCE|nr:hypothetical protein P5673_031658 [Acropora cervicornis]